MLVLEKSCSPKDKCTQMNKDIPAISRDSFKANLKKLRLRGVTPTGNRSSSSIRKTRSTNSTASKYFHTPLINQTEASINKDKKQGIDAKGNHLRYPPADSKNSVQKQDKDDTLTAPEKYSSYDFLYKEASPTKTNRKRTKLKDFVLKNGTNIPQHDKPNYLSEKDVEDLKKGTKIPLKEVKKAAKVRRNRSASTLKPARSKNFQPDIRKSLLRSERIFSEITAQHCRLDNFSPDEIQLALALSKSETETSGTSESLAIQQYKTQNNEGDKTNAIKHILQQYGFRTLPEGYNNLTHVFTSTSNQRCKFKRANRFTALTLGERKNQRKKIDLRIRSLMDKQLVDKLPDVYEDNFATYSLISKDLAQLKTTNDFFRLLEREYSTNLQSFYVQDLFEVSHVKAGYLLKDWHKIQGREKSPETEKGAEISKQMQQHHMNINNKSSEKNRTRKIGKDTFTETPNEPIGSIPIHHLQESLNAIKDNTEKDIINVKLNEGIEETKRLTSSNRSIDIFSGSAFNRNELELSPHSCSNAIKIRSRSPNIFSSSEDESDKVVRIRTLEKFSFLHTSTF
ncbi:structure-specific endonuclease subunit SLX4 isoform X2 [Eurosta solidaginis]|uniref:structure-specific endonuclease subunit SLX4 isoform X2 n=1 Tax=Eurosta solidaginis TaxID=178769 RepID=UPI003530FF9B